MLVSTNSDGEDDSDSDSEMETDPLQVGVSTVCSWKRAPIAVNLLNWSLLVLTSASRCLSIFCKYLPALTLSYLAMLTCFIQMIHTTGLMGSQSKFYFRAAKVFWARVIADAFFDHIRYSGSVVQFLISSVKFFC